MDVEREIKKRGNNRTFRREFTRAGSISVAAQRHNARRRHAAVALKPLDDSTPHAARAARDYVRSFKAAQ